MTQEKVEKAPEKKAKKAAKPFKLPITLSEEQLAKVRAKIGNAKLEGGVTMALTLTKKQERQAVSLFVQGMVDQWLAK